MSDALKKMREESREKEDQNCHAMSLLQSELNTERINNKVYYFTRDCQPWCLSGYLLLWTSAWVSTCLDVSLGVYLYGRLPGGLLVWTSCWVSTCLDVSLGVYLSGRLPGGLLVWTSAWVSTCLLV